MKRGKASRTSALVALFRALADAGITRVPGFADPTARRLLSASWALRLEKAKQRARSARFRESLERAADQIALRTMVLDAHLREAILAGARQLVILGAGLDGRAFRMPELADVDVLELDHPDTQVDKRERSAALARTARSLRFVAMDFERDDLATALESAGHRPVEPTLWLWEGVVMYLRDEAVRSTLAVLAARSAPGSTLVVQYNTREGQNFAGRLLLWLWGEPQIGLRDPAEIAAELSAAGFRAHSDTGTADWAARYGVPTPSLNAAKRARIVVARR